MDICYPAGTDWGCSFTDDEIAALSPDLRERSEALAWSTLAALTGYRLSLCPVLLRPCAARCTPGTWYAAPVVGGWTGAPENGVFTPYISGGTWFNGCGCLSDCSCTVMSIVNLPPEVGGIEAVWLDGALLDPAAYRVDNGNELVRTDGGTWPLCQDMNLPLTVDSYSPFEGTYGTSGTYEFVRVGDTVTVIIHPDAVNSVGINFPDRFRPATYQVIGGDTDTQVYVQNLAGVGTFLVDRITANPPPPLTFTYLAVPAPADVIEGNEGTFGVSYYPGVAPNDMLRFAAGVLASEFYKACTSNRACRLPSGVTAVTRNGITMDIPSGLFPAGATGIQEVDAVIRIYNPYGLGSPPRVMSPDARRGRAQTWISN